MNFTSNMAVVAVALPSPALPALRAFVDSRAVVAVPVSGAPSVQYQTLANSTAVVQPAPLSPAVRTEFAC